MDNNRIFLSTPGDGVARAVRGTNGEWTVETSLTDLTIYCLAADPRRPGTVYAGAKGGGVFRSEDEGKTWRAAGLDGQTVKALAVSPQDSDTVYAGGKPISMFVTRDGGATWKELESFRRVRRFWMFSPADPGDMRAYVQAIALSPSDPNVILAGLELGAVVRSEDGGATWSGHRRGALRDCHSLKFHSLNGDWAYEAGGTGGGTSMSRDGGRTWQKVKGGLAKNYGVACGADPENPEIWYVSVAPNPGKAYSENGEVYLYRSAASSKNGDPKTGNVSTEDTSWVPIGWAPHPLSQMPTALVTDPQAPGHIYAGLAYGDVWHSTDYGNTWEKLPFNLKGIWSSLLVMRA
jgi:photosystem II stability/assembly factor-like uncharacterized protein